MDGEAEPSVWQETTGHLRPVEGGRSTLPSPSSRTATEPTRIDRAAFAAELTPCLALSSGVGMSGDDRREWLNAAYKAIGHYPLDLLKRGAAEALRTADHPSKIVPAITACAQPILDERARQNASAQKVFESAHALPAPRQSRCSPEEAAEISARYKVGRHAVHRAADPSRPIAVSATADPERPCRVPKRADYIRLFGIDPEAATHPDTGA